MNTYCAAGDASCSCNELRHRCLLGKIAGLKQQIERLKFRVKLEKRQLHQEQAQMLVYSSPDYFEPRKMHFCTNSYGLTTDRLNPTTGPYS
ncbi:unnamed protein product [Phyllotreta striolata]|uniref:Uncharacterized protein n=1 Tax=Phyllotreta striolata TaxID=444603 RepID=A0A9N9TKI9_PHYSR|nr:unnamed protein product [Phyllotreta striolata]